MKLNSGELKSAIVGMVIGDGSLTLRHKNGNAYLQMTHSENQYDYLLWKRDIIDQLAHCTIHPNHGTKYIGGKIYEGRFYHLDSKRHPTFTKLYRRFYHQGHKCLDEYLVKKITPLALAIMWMDDGTVGRQDGKNDSLYLCVQGFDFANQQLLKKSLKIKFDLEWNLNRAGLSKGGCVLYRLRLAGTSRDRFMKIIKPFVQQVPCMSHKLASDVSTS